MNFLRAIGACCATCFCVAVPAEDLRKQLTFAQSRGATYEEVHRFQALGRLLIASDGSFFLYEWGRPYSWALRDAGSMNNLRSRLQTSILKVAVPDSWSETRAPTSEELFPAAPGATYYMGSLSPNNKLLSFYEVDWDSLTLRIGVAEIADTAVPKITWFNLPPDKSRLDTPPTWLSNNELLYPVDIHGIKFARANVESASAEPCSNCIPSQILQSVPYLERPSKSNTPLGRLIARSSGGELQVFVADTPEVLSLSFQKEGRVVELFSNSRVTTSDE